MDDSEDSTPAVMDDAENSTPAVMNDSENGIPAVIDDSEDRQRRSLVWKGFRIVKKMKNVQRVEVCICLRYDVEKRY